LDDKSFHRHRVFLPPKAGSLDVYAGGAFQFSIPKEYWTHFGEITDRINPIRFGTDNHRPPGPVVHDKLNVTYMAPITSYFDNGGAQFTVDMHGFAEALMSQMWPRYSPRNAINFDGWFNLLDQFELTPTYRNLCVTAFNKQIQQVPTATSVINFAIELIELKPIFKSLLKIPKHIRDGSLSKRVTGKHLSRRTPINVAKGGAKAFLAAEFGWLPFISDIMTFIGTMDAITKRLDYLRKTKGKETTVRFVKEDAYQRPMGEIKLMGDGPNSREHISLDAYQLDFISTWKLFQDLEGLEDEWVKLRAAFAYLGVNNPAKIVWNAIPFSFLVDWVTPVSDWLEKAAVQPFGGTWNVYDVTSSVKEVYDMSYNFYAKHGGTQGMVLRIHAEQYRRLPYLPITLGAVDFSQLSDTQQKLAAALVLSQGRR